GSHMTDSMNTLVTPLQRSDAPQLEPVFRGMEQNLGFLPNGILTMGKNPDLAVAFGGLFKCIDAFKHIPTELKWAIAMISSSAAGCMYCKSHFSHIATRTHVNRNKVMAAFEFQTSDFYNEAERAALAFAFANSTSPAHLDKEHFDELARYYSEEAAIEIAAIIAICGFLNRWNAAMDSQIEAAPRATLDEIEKQN
nr:Chain A, Debrominase Bmp8 [Marinomonas mediterranea MMB-1]6OHI_B Chain B, Debrominase Bmp8 [Marinomonas mediterranea MMB-1]